jgi:Zn finger protein HypA/HybF involved in hydrogenase expression
MLKSKAETLALITQASATIACVALMRQGKKKERKMTYDDEKIQCWCEDCNNESTAHIVGHVDHEPWGDTTAPRDTSYLICNECGSDNVEECDDKEIEERKLYA